MLIRFDVVQSKLHRAEELAPINIEFCEGFYKRHFNNKIFQIHFLMNSGEDIAWEFLEEKVRDKIYEFLQDRYVEVL